MSETQRNLLILVALAAVGVAFSGAFGTGANLLGTLFNIIFTVMIVSLAVILYRRHSGTIAQLPTTPKLVLQIATAALVLVIFTGTFQIALGGDPLLPEPFGWAGANPILFYGSIFACGFGIWWAWQQRVSRW